MSDPLAQAIELLRPRAVFSKTISGAGRWAVEYTEFGHPAFSAMIEGSCRLSVAGEEPVVIEAGDFVLLPATPRFGMSSLEPGPVHRIDARAVPPQQEVRFGRQGGPPDMRQFGGWFTFGAPDADLLVTLLPRMIHIRAAPRLAQLVQMLGCEAMRDDIGRGLILERLVEILLIEALRSAPAQTAQPGLLRGRRIQGSPPPFAICTGISPGRGPSLILPGRRACRARRFSKGSPGWSAHGRLNI